MRGKIRKQKFFFHLIFQQAFLISHPYIIKFYTSVALRYNATNQIGKDEAQRMNIPYV